MKLLTTIIFGLQRQVELISVSSSGPERFKELLGLVRRREKTKRKTKFDWLVNGFADRLSVGLGVTPAAPPGSWGDSRRFGERGYQCPILPEDGRNGR